jgi:hypothetical protein
MYISADSEFHATTLSQHNHGLMYKTSFSSVRVPWFDSSHGQFFILIHIHINNIKFIFIFI